jgi:uncharacterized membrane protein
MAGGVLSQRELRSYPWNLIQIILAEESANETAILGRPFFRNGLFLFLVLILMMDLSLSYTSLRQNPKRKSCLHNWITQKTVLLLKR